MCRWHVATAVAFPQKRNPTFSAKIKPSVRAAFSFNEQNALAVLCLSRAAAFPLCFQSAGVEYAVEI